MRLYANLVTVTDLKSINARMREGNNLSAMAEATATLHKIFHPQQRKGFFTPAPTSARPLSTADAADYDAAIEELQAARPTSEPVELSKGKMTDVKPGTTASPFASTPAKPSAASPVEANAAGVSISPEQVWRIVDLIIAFVTAWRNRGK